MLPRTLDLIPTGNLYVAGKHLVHEQRGPPGLQWVLSRILDLIPTRNLHVAGKHLVHDLHGPPGLHCCYL